MIYIIDITYHVRFEFGKMVSFITGLKARVFSQQFRKPKKIIFTVAGKGDRNNSAEYITAIQLLYGLSYTIKMGNKDILDNVVPPLEGLWTVDGDFKGGGATIDDKSKFIWTMMIRQHHEIYISDPRRTAPEKLKTVLRHPIRRMQSIQK